MSKNLLTKSINDVIIYYKCNYYYFQKGSVTL